ncbi:MAG: amidase, partial [Burkholderiaceae bacterium]
MTRDLTAARQDISAMRRSAASMMEESIAASAAPASAKAFLSTSLGIARAVAGGVDAALGLGAPLPPLAGLALSLKDLFDVHGEVTAAGSV